MAIGSSSRERELRATELLVSAPCCCVGKLRGPSSSQIVSLVLVAGAAHRGLGPDIVRTRVHPFLSFWIKPRRFFFLIDYDLLINSVLSFIVEPFFL